MTKGLPTHANHVTWAPISRWQGQRYATHALPASSRIWLGAASVKDVPLASTKTKKAKARAPRAQATQAQLVLRRHPPVIVAAAKGVLTSHQPTLPASTASRAAKVSNAHFHPALTRWYRDLLPWDQSTCRNWCEASLPNPRMRPARSSARVIAPVASRASVVEVWRAPRVLLAPKGCPGSFV